MSNMGGGVYIDGNLVPESDSTNDERQQPQPVRGGSNLQSMLSHYNHAANAPPPQSSGAVANGEGGGGSLAQQQTRTQSTATIQNIPSNLNLQLERDRASTFGSDFDLMLGLGMSVTNGDGAVVGMDSPRHAAVAPLSNPVTTAESVVSAGSQTSAGGSSAAGPPHPSAVQALPSAVPAPPPPDNQQRPLSSRPPPHPPRSVQSVQQQSAAGGGGRTTPPSAPSSQGSASGFLSGMFGVQQPPLPQSQPQQVQQRQQQQQPSSTALSHTPPTNFGTSYEAMHFGKRMRAGSISGRLRSASDLEDTGIIDREQKGILKDLIISGDDAIQSAIDRYEEGDTSALENMIKTGALANRSGDIDLLGDIDLDFLTVNDDDVGGMSYPAGMAAPSPVLGPADHGNIAAPKAQRSKSMPVPILPQSSASLTPQQSGQPGAPMVPQGGYEDDGIGDLDFNGDLTGAGEYMHLPSSSYGSQAGAVIAQPVSSTAAPPQESIPLNEAQRLRANSLAFGALLETGPTSAERTETSYGQWMDRHPQEVGGGKSQQLKKQNKSSKGNYVGTTGGVYIVADANGREVYGGMKHVGMGSTFAQQSAERTRDDIKLTASAINRLEQAAERRREMLEKKEQREREKREKKEQREREMRQRKEREAKEKQERKEKKAAAMKAKEEKKQLLKRSSSLSPKQNAKVKQEDDLEEERKETPSGLGRPRSMSDPNLSMCLDSNGLLHVDRPEGWVGAYSPASRKLRIERFLEKRNHRVWTKKVKYDVRKNFADSRLRVKGRFVKKEDELLMRDLMSLT